MYKLEREKAKIAEDIESGQERFWKISDAIWSYAELGLEEYKSFKLLADTLEEAGFTVERGVAGMPTAFVGSWSYGSGKPVIGFLAEYDALPMLSQKACLEVKEPIVVGAPGHGCGHNTMGAMQALAAITMRKVMEDSGLSGTLKYFGSPGEEMLVPRPYMIRAGLFDDVEVVIDCHVSWDDFKVAYGMHGMGAYSVIVTFKGKAAHAGVSPWLGRCAADAVELMHAGTERMREHLHINSRTHWITIGGGEAPNVVPEEASTWYFVRNVDEDLENHFNWVMDCARGAALMTQTTYEMEVLTAVHQRSFNKALAELIFKNMERLEKIKYTEKEQEFARALQKNAVLPIKGMDYSIKLAPPTSGPVWGGSSDVGEVSRVAPLATVRFPAIVPGSPSHHWTIASAAASSIAHKGITAGAKVVAFTTYDLLTKPHVLEEVRTEFEESSRKHPFKTFLPKGAKPPLGRNKAIMEKYRSDMEKFHINP